MKEALLTTAFWISLALLFNAWVYFCQGREKALLFLTAYLVEESLSIDNLFVFLLVFKYFKVPERHLHKILFWGIFGAIVFRAIFIWAGLALVSQFEWILYVFGVFLIIAGIKLALQRDQEIHPEESFIINFFQKKFRMNNDMESGKFIINGAITPLFLALVTIEISDIIFAIDSIPAVFAITRDPFIVYTSNIFAILGLRSLFFTVQNLLEKFYLLHYGLAFVLVFIGIKMVVEPWYHFPIEIALGTIVASISVSIIASLYFPKEDNKKASK